MILVTVALLISSGLTSEAFPRARAAPLFDQIHEASNDAEVIQFTDAAFTLETKKPIERSEMDEIVRWVEEQKNPIQVRPYISVRYKVAKVSVKSSRPFNWYEYTFYMVPTIDANSLEVLLDKSRQQMGWFHTIINYAGEKPLVFHNIWYTGRLKPVDEDVSDRPLVDTSSSTEGSNENGGETTTETRMMEMKWTTQKHPEGKWTTVNPRLGDDVSNKPKPSNVTESSTENTSSSTENSPDLNDSTTKEDMDMSPTIAVAETIQPVATEMVTTMMMDATTDSKDQQTAETGVPTTKSPMKDSEMVTKEVPLSDTTTVVPETVSSTTSTESLPISPETIQVEEKEGKQTTSTTVVNPKDETEPPTTEKITSTTPSKVTTTPSPEMNPSVTTLASSSNSPEMSDSTTTEINPTEVTSDTSLDDDTTTEMVTSTPETTTADSQSESTTIPPTTVLPIV